MEKPDLEKIIIFITIVLLPVLGLTIIPRMLFNIFQGEIDAFVSNNFYKVSLVVAAVIFVLILALSVYIVTRPYVMWGIAYLCGILYCVFMFINPGKEFNSLNFYILVISYAVDLVVLLAVYLKDKK